MTVLKTVPGFTYFKSNNMMSSLKDQAGKFSQILENNQGCMIKPNPKIFGFFVYWHCVNQLSTIVLYFPYLVLTLALILVLLERILTRYMWTGQRIEKFYDLLVKDVIDSGDIDKVDTKENRQKCRQVHYDFKGSWFYCKAYITQLTVKVSICLGVIGWSFFDQCNGMRSNFQTTLTCQVFDYTHQCSIPSNGINMVIFDIVNLVLFTIFIVAVFNLYWHLRFIRKTNHFQNSDSVQFTLKQKVIFCHPAAVA